MTAIHRYNTQEHETLKKISKIVSPKRHIDKRMLHMITSTAGDGRRQAAARITLQLALVSLIPAKQL